MFHPRQKEKKGKYSSTLEVNLPYNKWIEMNEREIEIDKVAVGGGGLACARVLTARLPRVALSVQDTLCQVVNPHRRLRTESQLCKRRRGAK